MTLEEHLRRCYSHDFPDNPEIGVEDALRVYRSGYLEGLRDGQHMAGETHDLKAQQVALHNFDRGYAQGIAYAAFAASHVGLPKEIISQSDYVIRTFAAQLMREAISAALEASAAAARSVNCQLIPR